MNNKVFLLSLSAILLFGCIFMPKIYISTLPQAYISNLEEIEYIEYVNATGEIQRSDSIDITTDIPIVIDEVYKCEGEAVEAGEKIAAINREETAKNIIELGEYAAIAGDSMQYAQIDYVSVINLIPEAVFATESGTIEKVNASGGDYIGENGIIATISSNNPLIITANISENRISKIEVGQSVIISSGAFGERTYLGHIERIADNATKEYSGTSAQTVVQIEIVIDNADEMIKSGFTTKLQICVSDARNIEILPYEALFCENEVSYVYVFEDGMAKRKTITTGVETAYGIEVLSGISSKDTVIYSENELSSGDYVAIMVNDN